MRRQREGGIALPTKLYCENNNNKKQREKLKVYKHAYSKKPLQLKISLYRKIQIFPFAAPFKIEV